jgi:hypothetical protein
MDPEKHREFDEWVASDDLMDHALDIQRDPGPKQAPEIDDRILACYYAIFAISQIPEEHLQQLKEWRAFQDAHFTLDQSVYDSMQRKDSTATAPIFPINHLAHFRTYFPYILEAFEKHNFLEEYATRYSGTRQFKKYLNDVNPPKGIIVEAVTGLRCLDVLIQKEGFFTTTLRIDNLIFTHVTTQNVPLFPLPAELDFQILELIYRYVKDVDRLDDKSARVLNASWRRRPTAVVRDGGENVEPDDVVLLPEPAPDTLPPPQPGQQQPPHDPLLSPRAFRAHLPALLAKLQALTL